MGRAAGQGADEPARRPVRAGRHPGRLVPPGAADRASARAAAPGLPGPRAAHAQPVRREAVGGAAALGDHRGQGPVRAAGRTGRGARPPARCRSSCTATRAPCSAATAGWAGPPASPRCACCRARPTGRCRTATWRRWPSSGRTCTSRSWAGSTRSRAACWCRTPSCTLAGPRGLAALRAAARPAVRSRRPPHRRRRRPRRPPPTPRLHRFDRAPQEVASGWRARLSADEIDLLEQSTAETFAALEQRRFSPS